MFTWLGTSVLAPAVLARRALRRGSRALDDRNFPAARRHFERAARYEPLREEAVCLMAEACLHDKKPSDALFALNTLLLEQDQMIANGTMTGGGAGAVGGLGGQGGRVRSPRVRLLRGLAGCMLGRVAAARRELAAISKSVATGDELLAAAQACVMANDPAGAQALLEKLDREHAERPMGNALAARVKLVKSALYFRLNAWEKSFEALPDPGDCTASDAPTCRKIRDLLTQKIRPTATLANDHG